MTERRTRAETDAFLKLARERFEQAKKATEKQRQRELQDLAFYAGGEHQWDPETLKARRAQDGGNGMPPVPARPSLTINKVREPVHQVLNQERQSDMSIELAAADDFGDLAGPNPQNETEIELREGLVRRIQRESEAADARTWAFTRATIAGVGYYGILVRYRPGKTWEKELYVRRFFNQASVSLDPAHEQPDGSDAEWGFIGTDMPWAQYKTEFPRVAGQRNTVAAADDATFRALGEEYPGWFKAEGETRSARVVEYFYTEREPRTLARLADGSAHWKDELPSDLPNEALIDERDVVQKRIKWAKIDATQILDETDWDGPDLPIIKVLGEELQPFDQERRVEGMVRPARDAQQGFNAFVSKWVEVGGLAPIPPFQIAEGQVEGYEPWYQQASTRALPYLPYRTKDLEGNPVGPPIRTNISLPIEALAASVQMFDEAIKSTTLVPSVQLGQGTDARLKSGRAINLLQQQAQLGTSNFLDNLRRSIRYEGQILNNLLYPVYGQPGRIVRILTGEGESQTVRIGPAPQIGMLGQAPTPQMGMPGMAPSPQTQTAPKTMTLTKDANFNIVVKISRGFESRRLEEASDLLDFAQQNPQSLAIFGDLLFKALDWPEHNEMADRMEVMLDPKIQAWRQSKAQNMPIPPQLQAHVVQLTQRLQQAEQIMAQAKQELQSDAQEWQAKLQIEREKMQHAEKLQAMKDATAIRVAELGAKKDLIAETYEDREEAIALAQEQAHEAQQNALDRAHAVAMKPPMPPQGSPSSNGESPQGGPQAT